MRDESRAVQDSCCEYPSVTDHDPPLTPDLLSRKADDDVGGPAQNVKHRRQLISPFPCTDPPGDAESYTSIQRYGLLQEHILGHERRSLKILWRLFQRLGVRHELAPGE